MDEKMNEIEKSYLSPVTKELLNSLRSQAFDYLKVKKDKSRFTFFELNKIIIIAFEEQKNRFCPHMQGVLEQIKRDYNVQYKKYDCLAMWLDPEMGLAAFCPEFIIRVAIEVCNLKEDLNYWKERLEQEEKT